MKFFYSRMQQAYNTSNTSYMNSNFYNTSSYGSYGLSSARSNPLNTPCKAASSVSGTGSSYLATPYASPGSPFAPATATPQSTIGSQYAGPYSGYSCAAAGSSGFGQGFSQVIYFRMIYSCNFLHERAMTVKKLQ